MNAQPLGHDQSLRKRRPVAFWLLISLLIFQGIAATPSGLLLVLDPTGGRLQLPLEFLENTPFPDYLIPGLILSIVLGLGAFFVAICLLTLPAWGWADRLKVVKGRHWTWTAAAAFGLGLMIWIAVQVGMLGLGIWLQPFIFGIGLAILLLTLSPPVTRYLSD